MEQQGIVVEKISVHYSGAADSQAALSEVSLDIQPGEFVCVTGPSGCGKTTLMNVLAGFIRPTSGRVMLGGREVLGPGPDRGVVFQQYAIFPWMSVRDNVEFGLTLAANRKTASERREIADHLIQVVGLNHVASRYPKELSGGMKQRLAIARAYAVNPKVLLMDEPFAALDVQTRQFMQEVLLKILEQEKKTVVFITHGVEEAVFLSNRVVIMASRPGRIRKILPVNLPYPRTAAIHTTPEFMRVRAEIEEIVREEFLELQSATSVHK